MDLKQTIRTKGIRQRDVAEKMDVSESTVSKWIHRKADVPAKMIRPFADALGVTVEDVLPLVDMTAPQPSTHPEIAA